MPYKTAEEATKGMLYKPDEWPRWPILPMKQRGSLVTGFLFGEQKEGEPITVYIGILGLVTSLDACDKEVYDDVIDLMGSGWVVD